MFSRSSLRRFTPWQFALNAIKKSHETLTWPSPESSCKILFDTPDMPPQLKLILYFMLRSRHLLICTTTTTTSTIAGGSASNSSSSGAPSMSPIASTFKAYSSALKAANEIYHFSGFSRHEFPLIATLNGDSWFGANEEIRNNNKSSNGSSSQQMWIPLPLQKAQKAGGKYQSLMQPKISSQFAEVVGSGTRDETQTKLFGGFDDKNKKRKKQHFMEQAKIQPSKQIVKLAAISSVARIRFAETPSLLAEVWSNILSDGIFDSMMIQVRTGGGNVSGVSLMNEVDQKHQEQIIVAVSDVLSSLFASRDHLLFNEKILDQVTSLALELLTYLQQYHLTNDIEHENNTGKKQNSVIHHNPKIAFAFAELCAHLGASLRLRGGCTTAASKMSEFLLLAHHLSLHEARYQNVFRHVTLPNEKELILPLKICFELFPVLRLKPNNFDFDDDDNNNNNNNNLNQNSILFRKFYEKSVQVVREEQTAVKERREKNFEEKLQEIAQVADALGKNPKNEQLLLTQKKREEHLKEVVLRDQQISKKISQAVDGEIAKIGKLVENNNDEKKSKTKQKSSKSTTSLDFYWSWNLNPAAEDASVPKVNDEISHEDGDSDSDSSIKKTTRTFGLTNDNNFVAEQISSSDPSTAPEVKDEYDVDEDEDGNFISRVQIIQNQQKTSTGLSLQADSSYGSVKFNSNTTSSSNRRVSESWIVSFHKSDIARTVELDPTPSLPSSQLLFLRWLLQNAQRQEDNEAFAALNEGDALVLNQRRRLFVSGKHGIGQNAQVSAAALLPTPTLETLFGSHLHGAPSFSQRADFRNARKRRTFSFPSTTTSSSSSSSSLTHSTVEVVPFLPSVFEISGHAQGENAQEMIIVKVSVALQNSDSSASSFDISEFLNQRLGLTPSVAVLTEIEYSGGEIVVVSEGMNEILS